MARILLILQRILVMLLLLGAVANLALRTRLLSDPRIDLGGAEMNVVYGVQKLLLGKPLYSDPEFPPFEVVQYTPLFHLLSAGVCAIAGTDPMDTSGLYLVSRSLALLLNLFSCAFVFLLCRRLGCEVLHALGAACVALILFTPHFFGRPEALASALVLAMVLILAGGGALDWRRAIAAAALAVLAVLAKQTAIVAPIIALAFLAWQNDRASLRRFATVFTLLSAIALGALLLTASPSILWKNLVMSMRNGLGYTLYHDLVDLGVPKYWYGWIGLTVAAGIAGVRSAQPSRRLVALAALVALGAGLLAGTKRASSMNYIVDGLLLGLPAGLAWLTMQREVIRTWFLIGFLAYGAFFMQHRVRLLRDLVSGPNQRTQRLAEQHADQAVHAWLLNQGGNRLDNPALITYRGHLELYLNGMALLPQKDIIEWSEAPPFDLSRLKRMLDDGQVKFIITDSPIEHLRLLGWSYVVDPIIDVEGRHVYRLKPN